MDYSRIYNQIVSKFSGIKPEGYSESHHILPRCLGGNNEPENLVELPARHHFVAHLLLAKIHGGKLIHAAWMMSNEGNYNSKKYQWLREAFAEAMKGNQINKGRKHSAETKAKVAAASKRRGVTSQMAHKSWETRRKNGTDKHTLNAIANIKAAHANMVGPNNPMFGRQHSAETKAKMGIKAAARMKGNQNTKGMRFKKIDGKMVRIK